ncbi:Uncharacterised protein [Leclercia adecarboxylata]|uniref:Uncharacterized protein n=1 Tax=Leclercia adecarboxylata TaxID=83655 RepID=A0A4V6YXZ9_9ENTR|nr:Uncharacterised protein [Leclercia adecarboxylata]
MGLAKRKPCRSLTPFFVRKASSLALLYPFRYDLQIQRLGDGNNRAHQRLRNRLLMNITYKRLIELYGIDGEAGQLRQRGVTGAKIIEMDLRPPAC